MGPRSAPPQHRHLRRLRAGVVLCLLAVTFEGWAQGIRPDYASTYGFAAALQTDYATQREKALQERINRTLLSQRSGAGFGTNKEDESTLISQLASTMDSALARELASLKQYPHLVVGRIAAIRGKRTLECLFFDEAGLFRVLFLTIEETSPGTLQIVDFSALGFPRSFVASLRDRLLFSGIPYYSPLNDDEARVERAMRPHLGVSRAFFSALAAENFDGAFTLLARLPEEVRALPVWRELRTRLISQGSERAAKSLAEERAWAPIYEDDFDRYIDVSHGRDTAEKLSSLNAVLQSAHQLPFLQLIKVDLLVELGRLEEGSRLAEHLRELNPLLIGAHLAVIRTAFLSGQEARALEALVEAGHIWKPEDLLRFLENDPGSAAWKQSPKFQAWAADARKPAATLTGPPSTPAP